MRIGIPIWNGRVSPLLDTAQRLTVVESAAAGPEVREEVPLLPPPLSLRASQIAAMDLDLLACGAVSRRLAEMLESAGVRVAPWLAGDADEVVHALESGEFDRSRFEMPGCGCSRRRGRGRRGRMQRGQRGREQR
jgi:predicted Fe-Mo cluster-binding NifX family protein